MERVVGAVIRISLPDSAATSGGIQLVAKTYEGTHDVGNLATAPKQNSDKTTVFATIDQSSMAAAYVPSQHQNYVDKRMAEIPPHRRGQVDQLRLLPNLLKPGKIETIAKSAIKNRRIAEVSSMPTGLLDTFNVDEIMDLLAFIQSRGVDK